MRQRRIPTVDNIQFPIQPHLAYRQCDERAGGDPALSSEPRDERNADAAFALPRGRVRTTAGRVGYAPPGPDVGRATRSRQPESALDERTTDRVAS